MDTAQLFSLYQEFYKNEPFVRLLPVGQLPNVRHVRGSNFCDIGVYADARTGRAVIVTAIDNLVKGASGQAIQNMNLMMGFDEGEGLRFAGLFP
jgi:N-acetyl-gamma-glutamyl-phosphate reductase